MTVTTPTPTVTGEPTWTSEPTATPTETTVPTGEIRGTVWEDINENGQMDLGEPPLSGARIILRDEMGNPLQETITGEDGFYSFPDLLPNTYIVQEVDPPGYFSTTVNSVLVELEAGELAIVNFGDKRLGGSSWGIIHLPAIIGAP